MMKIFVAFAFFGSLNAFAHGEDKPGPNGGYVRMPGAFHTELVLNGKNKLNVYLLDINWANPSVQDSSLEVSLEAKKIAQKADCQITDNHYLCSFSKTTDLSKNGKLLVKAKHEGQFGNEVSYDLPLKFQKK